MTTTEQEHFPLALTVDCSGRIVQIRGPVIIRLLSPITVGMIQHLKALKREHTVSVITAGIQNNQVVADSGHLCPAEEE